MIMVGWVGEGEVQLLMVWFVVVILGLNSLMMILNGYQKDPEKGFGTWDCSTSVEILQLYKDGLNF